MTDETHGSDLFDIIRTTRSMRRLKPDPMPNELIRKSWRRVFVPRVAEICSASASSWSGMPG
jgi:hypothetical protein